MDKRGALYFRLITALLALVLTVYLASALFVSKRAFTLQSAQACEVGDGISVSGFVVRSEQCVTSSAPALCAFTEGQRVSGGQALAKTANGTLVSAAAGYFSYITDGYETVLTPDFVKNASFSELLSLSAEVQENAFGRLIEGQTWYFAAPCPAQSIQIGQAVTLRFAETQCKAEVLRADTLLLLCCREKLQEVTDLRELSAEIIFQSYSGLRVPKAAIYYEDGEVFVYILQGARARRKKIEIVFHDGEDVLVQGELLEGAQVILTDIELTDGMVLQ